MRLTHGTKEQQITKTMKRTIEIDDTLQDCVDGAIEQVEAELISFLEQNERDEVPCLNNDLDHSGRIHEIVDGAVPIYTQQITDIFYLHGDEVEQAFDDSGCGDKNNLRWPCGWKTAAVYTYIEQKVQEWYHKNAEAIFDKWKEENKTETEEE